MIVSPIFLTLQRDYHPYMAMSLLLQERPVIMLYSYQGVETNEDGWHCR